MTRTLPSVALLALVFSAGTAFAQPEPPPPPPGEEPPPTAPPVTEPPPEEPPPTTPPPTEPPKPVPPPVGAQGPVAPAVAPTQDTGAKPTTPPAGAAADEKLAWRLTTFGWDHSASTETVGIGQDTQSRNPSYEMSFVALPRYYIWESADPAQAISIRARLDLIREFTNSDSTTNRGEWTFSDLSLFPQYGVTVYKDGDDVSTDLGLRLPTLAFPTSKVSANNGRIIQLGTMLIAAQKMPVLGSDAPALQNFTLTLRGAYSHWFTDATQPTNDDLNRVRTGPDGRSLPGDQLGGAANANHNVTFDVIGALALHEKVTWTNWFQWGLAYKYEFENQPICNAATGCVTPTTVDDPTSYAVTTLFSTELAFDVLKEFEIDVGYANLAPQIGPNGQRRNIFYSPDARVYMTFVAKLDEIYLTASGTRPPEPATARGTAKRTVAKNTKRSVSQNR